MMVGIDDGDRWKWDKHVNIAHVLTTVAMVTSVFVWINKTDQRISILEERITSSQAMAAALNTAASHQLQLMREEFRAVREEMVRTNGKLDRFVELQIRDRNDKQ
jgi:hypothetical protein